MASGNQLIQDYATIQNQMGDYFNTITLNVSSISSFGTIGSVGNLITLNPDGGFVDITTLPNLVNLNSNTTALSYDGSNTVFTSQVDILNHLLSISLIGSSNKTTITNDVLTTTNITAGDGISAGGQIIGNELRGQTLYVNTIKDSDEKDFFVWDSLGSGNTSTIATAAHFSTITYSELVPKPQVLIPTSFYVGTTTASVVNTSASNADLVGHSFFTTIQSGHITANATVQFENTATSQIHNTYAFMRLTDSTGTILYYETVPIGHSISHRVSPEEPYYITTSLLLRSPTPLPADNYDVAVYAYADSSLLTLTSSRCDILTYSGLS